MDHGSSARNAQLLACWKKIHIFRLLLLVFLWYRWNDKITMITLNSQRMTMTKTTSQRDRQSLLHHDNELPQNQFIF
jgi:hypothetical protein